MSHNVCKAEAACRSAPIPRTLLVGLRRHRRPSLQRPGTQPSTAHIPRHHIRSSAVRHAAVTLLLSHSKRCARPRTSNQAPAPIFLSPLVKKRDARKSALAAHTHVCTVNTMLCPPISSMRGFERRRFITLAGNPVRVVLPRVYAAARAPLQRRAPRTSSCNTCRTTYTPLSQRH